MENRDQMDPTVIGHILATMKDLGSHVMDIKAGVVSITGKLDTKADKEDIAELRISMMRHSKNPSAHGMGITRAQWAKIGGLITALTTLATVVATYFSG